jgi:hypothetical protein
MKLNWTLLCTISGLTKYFKTSIFKFKSIAIFDITIENKNGKTYLNFICFCSFLTVFFSNSITVHYCSKNTVTVTVMDTVLPVIITGNHYLWTL